MPHPLMYTYTVDTAPLHPVATTCHMHMHTVSSITDVYTVSQLKSHMGAKPEYSPSSLFTGIVYAVLTSLDIDTDNYKTVIGQKW